MNIAKPASTANRPRSAYDKLYIEEDILEDARTLAIRKKFPSSTLVPIGHYKDIFNRPRQDWRAQKRHPSLILAKRREDFIYDASAYTPNFGHQRFFYNALALNCVFDCAYCYLQGMFPSAYTTLFLNNEDYFQATDRELQNGPLYLALSYDTDLLALEHLFPYCRRWLEYTRSRSNLTVELRTKSVRYKLLRDCKPLNRFILAWTLSPDPVIKKYEPGTPSLQARLRDLTRAARDGWPVRVCLDPVLLVENWKEIYGECIDQILTTLEGCTIQDFCIGVFRINKGYLKNMQKRAMVTDLLYHPYETKGKCSTYPHSETRQMMEFLRHKLRLRPEPVVLFSEYE